MAHKSLPRNLQHNLIEASPVLDQVTALTGLPEAEFQSEMAHQLNKVGADPQTADINDLRRAAAALLAEIMGPECTETEES